MKNSKRRCAQHSRGFGFGNFGFLKSASKGTDVLVGALAGVAGISAIKLVINKTGLREKIPSVVGYALPLISGAVAGGALYVLDHKVLKMGSRAAGHALGAVMAGAAINAWDLLATQFPSLADVVSLPLSDYGILANDANRQLAAYQGMIVDEPARGMGGMYNDEEGLYEMA